ncbi:MAG: tetratricopeptide repeat protein [Pseudomonadota bacterium]
MVGEINNVMHRGVLGSVAGSNSVNSIEAHTSTFEHVNPLTNDPIDASQSPGGIWRGISERVPGFNSAVDMVKRLAVGIDAHLLQRGLYPWETRSTLINSAAALGAVVGAVGTGDLTFESVSLVGLGKKKKGGGSQRKTNKNRPKKTKRSGRSSQGSGSVNQSEPNAPRRFVVITGGRGRRLSSEEMLLEILEGAQSGNIDNERVGELAELYYKKNSEDAGANVMYGIKLLEEGRTKEALPHLRYVQRYDEADSELYGLLVRIETTAGDLNLAKQVVDHALERFPGEEDLIEIKEMLGRVLEFGSADFPQSFNDCILLAKQNSGTPRASALLNHALQMVKGKHRGSFGVGDVYGLLATNYFKQGLYTWSLNTFRLMEQHGGTDVYSEYCLYLDALSEVTDIDGLFQSCFGSQQHEDSEKLEDYVSFAEEGEYVARKALKGKKHHGIIYERLLVFLVLQGKVAEFREVYSKGRYHLEQAGFQEEDYNQFLSLANIMTHFLNPGDE